MPSADHAQQTFHQSFTSSAVLPLHLSTSVARAALVAEVAESAPWGAVRPPTFAGHRCGVGHGARARGGGPWQHGPAAASDRAHGRQSIVTGATARFRVLPGASRALGRYSRPNASRSPA
jgi:hypothetical protein